MNLRVIHMIPVCLTVASITPICNKDVALPKVNYGLVDILPLRGLREMNL